MAHVTSGIYTSLRKIRRRIWTVWHLLVSSPSAPFHISVLKLEGDIFQVAIYPFCRNVYLKYHRSRFTVSSFLLAIMWSTISFVALTSLSISIATPAHAQQLSAGCGKPLPSGITLGKSKNLTITSDSGASPRKYRIHVPTSYDINEPVPLILSFHGRGDDMKYQEELSQFSNASYGFEGIAVYPQGVPVSSTKLIYLEECHTDSITELQRDPPMARRPRSSHNHKRHNLHPGTNHPHLRLLLHRHNAHLRRREVQRRRLHGAPGLLRTRQRPNRRLRARIRRFLPRQSNTATSSLRDLSFAQRGPDHGVPRHKRHDDPVSRRPEQPQRRQHDEYSGVC